MEKGTQVQILVIGLIIGTAVTRPSLGQVGLSLPPVRDEEVRGLRFGEFIFSPFLELRGQYTTNLFREASEEGPSGAAILTVIPGFKLENKTPSLVLLRWNASTHINQFFSDDPNAEDQGRFAASTDLRVDFLPRSLFGFFVLEQFRREQLPPNLSTSATYDRNYNHVEAGLVIRPGGALQFNVSYAYNFMIYDDREDMDFWYHEARLLATWDLMPKTTILLDADFEMRRWRRPQVGLRTDSSPLRILAGMRGFVTKKVGGILKLGFGKGFYKEGRDFTNFIGEAGIAYQPQHSVLLEVGYRRGFEDSYYANWYIGDTGYLKFAAQLFGRLNISLEGEYTYVQYASFDPTMMNPTFEANQESRRDHALRAKATALWSFFRYLEFEVGYALDALLTDFRLTTPAGADSGKYVIHHVYGGLRFIY